MANSTATMIFTLILTIATMLFSSSLSFAVSDHQLGWFPASATQCRGTIGECMLGQEGEFEVDSDINRRMLAIRRRYISYGALKRNVVPCSRRGASYYNCRTGAQKNPYTRGCSAITRCRS